LTFTVSQAAATTTTSGQLQWAKAGQCGSSSGVWPHLTTDRSGNAVVAGYFQSTVDFGSGLLTSAGGMDCFIAKYNPQGALLWAKRFGGPSHDEIRGVATDSGGNIIVAGYFSGTMDFGGVTLTSFAN